MPHYFCDITTKSFASKITSLIVSELFTEMKTSWSSLNYINKACLNRNTWDCSVFVKATAHKQEIPVSICAALSCIISNHHINGSYFSYIIFDYFQVWIKIQCSIIFGYTCISLLHKQHWNHLVFNKSNHRIDEKILLLHINSTK